MVGAGHVAWIQFVSGRLGALAGRVAGLSEADLRNFGRAMAAGFTLGLGGHSFQVVQILLAEQRVVSFKTASSGTSYKAMKWMAQDFVPWLIQVGLKTDAKATSD